MRTRATFLIVVLAGVAGGLSLAHAAEAAELSVAVVEGPVGGSARVEVSMRGASDVGALDLALRYDPAVARFLVVERGPLARNVLLEANEIEPGRLLIALAISEGMTAEGVLLRIEFDVVGVEGDRTAVSVEAANAYHHEELIDLPLGTTGGEITVVAAGSAAVAYLFLAAVVALVLILMVTLRRRA